SRLLSRLPLRPPRSPLFPYTTLFRSVEHAVKAARDRGVLVRVGNVFSTDLFYIPQLQVFEVMAKMGILTIEMKAAKLYGLHLDRSEEHTSELQSLTNLVCRLLLEKNN